MSKQEINSIINSSDETSQSMSSKKIKFNNLLGNKTKRKKAKRTPKKKKSFSKSKTNYKTSISRNTSEKGILKKNNTKEIKLNDILEFYEQIEKELNKNYINQNKILMADYIKKSQNFNSLKRNILLDWIMGICCISRFKRETFHMTVSLIDICFSKINDIANDKIQIIGASCLIIASKFLEIYIPSLQKFSEFTGEAYTIQEFIEYEKKILKLLDWKLNYINIFQWSNIILYKWNIFIEKYFPLFNIHSDNNKLYKLYFYILDSIVLDYSYRFYNMKHLCSAIIYLLFGYKLESINLTILDFSKLKNYENFFNKFIEINKSLSLDNFRECIPYVLLFINNDLIENQNYYLNFLKNNINNIYQDYDKNKSNIAKKLIKAKSII